jgi:GcrA cell cycle regulator
MPAWQLETSSPELYTAARTRGRERGSVPVEHRPPLPRRERDRGARHDLEPGLEHARESNRTHHEGINMIAHGATWTSERIEQLKGCIGAGLSCSQIAAEIGVTRNAVIGKMNRLGLSRPKNVLAKGPEQKRDAWRPRALTQLQILMQLPPEPLARAEGSSIHDGRGCSLLELSPGKCRWPLSEPGTEHFCFCGNTQVEGLPYCVGHARIAYKSAARARSSARV